jgi:hypothetical protein
MNPLRPVDHQLYALCVVDTDPEPWEIHFMGWYESRGKIRKEQFPWNSRLKDLIKGYDRHEIVIFQDQISKATFFNLYQDYYRVAESTARNLVYQIQSKIKPTTI